MVAVAVVEPIVALFYDEATTGWIVLSWTEDVERMDVFERVACCLAPYAYVDGGDSHIGEGVVPTFDEYTNGIFLVISYDVYVYDVSV